MKTPICQSCGWGNSLCSTCKAKLASGVFSALDVEVSRILYKINEQHNLSLVSFTHSLDVGNQVLIFTDSEPGVLIGRGGKVVSALSAALGKRVRIIAESGDSKRSLEDLLMPVKVAGINEVFHSGVASLRIRLNKSDENRLSVDVQKFVPLVSTWMGKPVEFVFE